MGKGNDLMLLCKLAIAKALFACLFLNILHIVCGFLNFFSYFCCCFGSFLDVCVWFWLVGFWFLVFVCFLR